MAEATSGGGSGSGAAQTPWASDIDAAGYNLSDLGKLNLDDATTLTIATGAITITQSYHLVDTEAAAATDDLDTISGGIAGDRLFLRSANAARTVVVKHGTGNIITPYGNDYALDSPDRVIQLIYDGTNWLVIGLSRRITVSTSDPSGGADGDIWIKYAA